MGSFLGGSPKVPGPDPETQRRLKEAEAKAAKAKSDEEARVAHEEDAKKRRLRGRRSLLSQENVGGGFGAGDTLG